MAQHSLTAAEQRELQTRMEQKQMKDFMNVRHRLSTQCTQNVGSVRLTMLF